MDPLQVKAYEKWYDNLTSETQELLLEKLLKSPTGEKVLYKKEVSKMMEWFTDPIARNLIERCPVAEKYILTHFTYNSAWENINSNLRTWFVGSNVITHVSEDKKIVFMSPKGQYAEGLETLEVDGVELKKEEYDLKLITETDFDLNNLYMGYNTSRKWWIHCSALA